MRTNSYGQVTFKLPVITCM